MKRLFSNPILRSAALVTSLIVGACGGPPKLTMSPDHVSKQLYTGNATNLAGTYTVTGEFAGAPSTGSKLTITQTAKAAVLEVKRTTADGTVLSVGTGAVIGDDLYIAWELAAPSVMERRMVQLYVSELKPGGIEGFQVETYASAFSGSYGGGTPAGKLAVGANARYSLVKEQTLGDDEAFGMYVKRYPDQMYTVLTDPRGTAFGGTSLWVNDSRLVSAVLSDNQKNVPTIAVGVYKIAQGAVSGSSVFMDMTVEDAPPHGGMGGTLKLAPNAEQWALDVVAAPAATP